MSVNEPLLEVTDLRTYFRTETGVARAVHHCGRLGFALHPIDRTLHVGIEVLYPEAHAVEAERAQRPHRRGADRPRVNLDRIVAVVLELEMRAEHVEERAKLAHAVERRAAAAPVHLADPEVGLEAPAQIGRI